MRIVAMLTSLLAAGLIAGLASSALSETRSETYTDKSGDASPDITTVAVSHVGGAVTLSVTALGMGTPPEQGTWHGIWVYVEPDDDTSPASAPYMLDFEDWVAGTACVLHKNDGASYTVVASAVTCSRSGDTVTWAFPTSEIGANEMFSFFVVAWHLSHSGGAPLGQDRAPDFGRWGYSFAVTTTSEKTTPPAPLVKPVIGEPSPTPVRPVAGKAFSVSFPISRSDTGEPLLSGAMRLDPTIAGRVLAHRERFASGKARLWMSIPAATRGRLLNVRVTIRNKNASTSRTATFRIAPR